MARQKSATEAAIAAKLQTLDPASTRYHMLSAAQKFKASWVELGERLTTARETQSYTAWGFASFELYCRRELQLKAETANKLTRSFSYLRDHEPKVLGDRQSQALPSLDVVDLLSQAQKRTQISPDAFATIHEQVMAPEAHISRAEVLKKLREVDPEAFKPAAKAKETGVTGPNDLRKALLLAERLESLLAAQADDRFEAVARKASAVVTALREQYEHVQSQARTAHAAAGQAHPAQGTARGADAVH